jgi:hypothetical protein
MTRATLSARGRGGTLVFALRARDCLGRGE